MNVRQAITTDIKQIVQFQVAMAMETENLRLQEEVVQLGVAGVFENPERGSYYIAESDGLVVGSLLTTYEWSDWRNGTVIWIQSVYVLPAFRLKGVYRALYNYIRNKVISDPGLFGIRLYVDMSNNNAQQAYSHLGMNSDHYKTFEWMK